MDDDVAAVLDRMGLQRDALAGQVAVVTGAGRGIGRQAARALAWLGARVAIAEISEQGQLVADEIRTAAGDALYVRTDVSDEASVAGLADQVRAAYGPVSILVNNAIVCPVVPVVEMGAAEWDRVMGINLRGTFLTCRVFLPGMIEHGAGTIVNLVSADAMPGLAAYIASKQGIVGFSQSLALEVGDKGVHVVAFGPGMVDTPGIRTVAPDLAPRLGLTEAQFLHVPLHAAYDGLMPAVHAGAAIAYLVTSLAEEYHGDVVDGYTVLERAGVLSGGAQAARPAAVGADVAVPPSSADEALPQEALDLARRLQAALAETEAEFEQLPFFARPMARRGFKSKAGAGIQDWKRIVADLVARLEKAPERAAGAGVEARRRGGGGARAGRYLPPDADRWCPGNQAG